MDTADPPTVPKIARDVVTVEPFEAPDHPAFRRAGIPIRQDARIRFWTVSEGGFVSPADSFDFDCYKWVALETKRSTLHIICGDDSFALHRHIVSTFSTYWSGPKLKVLGGGLGGDAFPGRSTQFGPAPRMIIERLRDLQRASDPAEIRDAAPDWLAAVLDALSYDRTLSDDRALIDAVIAASEAYVPPEGQLPPEIHRVDGAVEIEWYDADAGWALRRAKLTLNAFARACRG